MKRRLITWLVILAVILGVAALFIEVIPPKAMTLAAMTESAYRIKMHVEQTGMLPASLDRLPTRDGYANRIDDGWGHPLRYEITGSNEVLVASLGKDGRPGGTGDDGDILKRWVITRSSESGAAERVEVREAR